jgi:uncharacterized protein (DUF2336 family)
MLVKSFLAWIERAGPEERAEAVDMLAKAFLAQTMGEEQPELVESALTLMLDDRACLVRRTLSIALADHLQSPRHIVLALASDQAEVAAPILARSPVLQEADMVDLAGHVELRAQIALALRATVSPRLSQALIARQNREVCLALLGNPGAEIANAELIAIATSFGRDQAMREALLARASVPVLVRYQLMMALNAGSQLAMGDVDAAQAERARRTLEDTQQQGIISIAGQAGEELPDFIRHLREEQKLTPGLLLRAVLAGDLAFLTEALADLTEMSSRRVLALMQGRADATLAALFRRAGLPDFLESPLIAGVRAAQQIGQPESEGALSLIVIRAVQNACLSQDGADEVRLLALLRRYEADAARLHSRKLADELRVQGQGDAAQLVLNTEQTYAIASLGADDDVLDLSIFVDENAVTASEDMATAARAGEASEEADLFVPTLPAVQVEKAPDTTTATRPEATNRDAPAPEFPRVEAVLPEPYSRKLDLRNVPLPDLLQPGFFEREIRRAASLREEILRQRAERQDSPHQDSPRQEVAQSGPDEPRRATLRATLRSDTESEEVRSRPVNLRALIEDWKRERGEGLEAGAFANPPAPANQSERQGKDLFARWELRRNVA